MQFKIGQPMITIMNMFNIIEKHTIKIFKNLPCRQIFPSPIIPLIYVPWHNLNSNVSLNWTSLCHSCYGCTWNSKIACILLSTFSCLRFKMSCFKRNLGDSRLFLVDLYYKLR